MRDDLSEYLCISGDGIALYAGLQNELKGIQEWMPWFKIE